MMKILFTVLVLILKISFLNANNLPQCKWEIEMELHV